uniref:Thymidine kinase n=1 Tax=Triticum urartu TaxID=4572 RepID=A0A8R7THC3_TRIUA
MDAPLSLCHRVQRVQRRNPPPFNLAAMGVPHSTPSPVLPWRNNATCRRNRGGSRTSSSAVQLGMIHVIVGPMFAGKITLLLRRHR